MSNVIPFAPTARKAIVRPVAASDDEARRRRRASMAAGLRLGFRPDFMQSKAEAQPYIDALTEAAREVADDVLRSRLMVLATALIARSVGAPSKPKKRRGA